MCDKYNKRMEPGLEEKIKSYIEGRENDYLSEFAYKNEDGSRRKQRCIEDIRTKCSRDADRNYISYSKEISESVEEYKEFNYEYIYNNEKLLSEKEKIETMYKILYEKFLKDLGCEDKTSKIYPHFIGIDWISKEYLENSSPAEQVRDYIAGMTDRYFERVFKEVMLPKRVTTFTSNGGL